MFANRMIVGVTVRCGECNRIGTTTAQLTPNVVAGELVLRSDNMQPPADWTTKKVDSRVEELFCPICSREAL
jgi:hypothetical protein